MLGNFISSAGRDQRSGRPSAERKDAIGWEQEALFPPMAFEEAEDQTARHRRSHRAPVKRHSACTVSWR